MSTLQSISPVGREQYSSGNLKDAMNNRASCKDMLGKMDYEPDASGQRMLQDAGRHLQRSQDIGEDAWNNAPCKKVYDSLFGQPNKRDSGGSELFGAKKPDNTSFSDEAKEERNFGKDRPDTSSFLRNANDEGSMKMILDALAAVDKSKQIGNDSIEKSDCLRVARQLNNGSSEMGVNNKSCVFYGQSN